MNSAQAIKIGELARRQKPDADVEVASIRDHAESIHSVAVLVKFQDHMSYDTYTIDPAGKVTNELLGQRMPGKVCNCSPALGCDLPTTGDYGEYTTAGCPIHGSS